ncbi:calmodulin-binding protein kinase (Serine/threonine-protein kinase domain protein) [Colletotrichum tabaci]|uniref:Calmodulin-binding protein kinase (Serine/threonine-protein kinase domain protein) n=1 Tax=Colletotrichum tabaci TaxID=1209068 RepID=A0AAV9SZ95_9PEZI
MRLEEAMLLRGITHEHIVKFHAFIIESDSLLLVMEFVDGRNLEQEFKTN